MGNSSTQFSASTTAEEAIRNRDLTDKWALVTGCSAGIGIETARVLHAKNCNLVMACRDAKKMASAAELILQSNTTSTGKLIQMTLDTSVLTSVQQFAAEYRARSFPLHMLILNAGIMACPFGKTVDGFELQMGTNHFGHFALTMLLMDVLKQSQPARVVVVSGGLYKYGQIDMSDLLWEKRGYGQGLAAYNASKLANVVFARELNKRCKAANVNIKAYSLHPGVIQTELSRYQSLSSMMGLFSWFLKTIPQGAATTIYCATAPEIENLGGEYFSDCAQEAITHAQVLDEKFTSMFFDESLKMTNSSSFLK